MCLQLPVSRRSDGEPRHQRPGCRRTRRPHSGVRGAVRVVLRDGLHIPAVQDLRRERQGRAAWAVRAPVVYSMSHSMAGRSVGLAAIYRHVCRVFFGHAWQYRNLELSISNKYGQNLHLFRIDYGLFGMIWNPTSSPLITVNLNYNLIFVLIMMMMIILINCFGVIWTWNWVILHLLDRTRWNPITCPWTKKLIWPRLHWLCSLCEYMYRYLCSALHTQQCML